MMKSSSKPVRRKSSLRSVINEVTKGKLGWLEEHRQVLLSHYTPILEKYEKPENKASLAFLKEVHQTLVSARDDNPDEMKTKELSVFLNWINVEDEKASMYFGSKRIIENWISELIKDIRYRIEKFEYSCIYANVMSQYMESNTSTVVDEELEDGDLKSDKDTGSFSSTTKEKTIQEFSRLVFSEPENFNKESFEEFLNTQLFNYEDEEQKKVLNMCRVSVMDFCKSFEETYPKEIGLNNLKLCIDGLLKDKCLAEDKIQTLKELRENNDALGEVCVLIDKRIRNYTEWSWPEPVYVDFRRNIAGRYRAYMDEDIITAIIIHYLGAQWSIKMESVFKSIYDSSVWKHGSDFVCDQYGSANSIDSYRRGFHRSAFLSILPKGMQDLSITGAGYDDDDDKYSARGKRSKYSYNDFSSSYQHSSQYSKHYSNEFSPMEVKKKLLHLIVNEIHLNFVVRPMSPLTIVQTDVEWFGPSIVHEAVLSAMKFFGVTDNWLKFFKNFLEAPLRVGSRNAPAQFRKRGAPLSHTFTTLFGETLLFIMDLYVNQVSGINIFRIHDDFWFWGSNKESVIKAWTAMQTFTKLADLKLNQEKSASVVCSKLDEPGTINLGPEPLPQRKVKWGFVVLHSDGVFRISQDLLEPHVREMQNCLQSCETVMNWVHCHNKYIRFFIRNFIEPARTLQIQHVQQILETLHLILGRIHSETDGDVVAALKLKFFNILGDKDIIDTWVHWPIHEGGLNLYNPFLDLIPLHEAYRRYDNKRFEDLASLEKWNEMLEKSKKRRELRQGSRIRDDDETITDDEMFEDTYVYAGRVTSKPKYTWERVDYTTWCQRTREYAEKGLKGWRARYELLLKNLTGENCGSGNWRQWLYDGQFHSTLGKEKRFVDTKLVPLSLISSIQAARVHKN